MSRRKTIISSIIVLAVVFVLATRYERVQRGQRDYAVVDRLVLGQGRTVLILVDDEPFETPAFFYEVHVNDQIVSPAWFLYGSGPDPRLEILMSRDNSVIGLVLKERPGEVYVLHDFASGASWPRHQDRDTYESSEARGNKLLDILQADHPETKLVLSSDVH